MKVKRKGAYQWEREWYQDQSALVVPKAAEAHLIQGINIEQFIRTHDDFYDFLMRVRIQRTSRLVWVVDGYEYPMQRITRYYVSETGGTLVKIMPPLKTKDSNEDRRMAIEKGWLVTPCNRIEHATAPINYDYYIQETEKLCLGLA